MKKFLALALFAAAGCGPAAAPPPPDGDSLVMDLIQQPPFDAANAKVGDWALYFVKKRGETKADPVKYSVVAEEGSLLWVEHLRTVEGMRLIVKSKYDRTNKLLEQWYGEPGSMPAQIYPGKGVEEPAPPPRRDSGSAKDQTERKSGVVVEAGGKQYICTQITTTLVYPDGRKSTMVNWCSKDVPLGTKEDGGLVKRTFGRLTLELMEHGTGARSELTIPILKK